MVLHREWNHTVYSNFTTTGVRLHPGDTESMTCAAVNNSNNVLFPPFCEYFSRFLGLYRDEMNFSCIHSLALNECY